MLFSCLVARPPRNPATISVEADDAAEAAFRAWSKFHRPIVVNGQSSPPTVRVQGDVHYVDGTAVWVSG